MGLCRYGFNAVLFALRLQAYTKARGDALARVGSRSPAAEAVGQLLLWGHPAAWLPTPIMAALLQLAAEVPDGDQAELVLGAYQLLASVTKVGVGLCRVRHWPSARPCAWHWRVYLLHQVTDVCMPQSFEYATDAGSTLCPHPRHQRMWYLHVVYNVLSTLPCVCLAAVCPFAGGRSVARATPANGQP